MRIGINLLSFKAHRISGLMIYGKNLLKSFGRFNQGDHFFLFITPSFPQEMVFNYGNFHYIKVPVDPHYRIRKVLFEQLLFPFYLRKYKIDLLFNPTVFRPLVSFLNHITGVHSGGPLSSKPTSLSNIYLKFMYFMAVKFSSLVITISNFSKKEILDHCRVPKNKIKVIYHGVPEQKPVHQKKQEQILKKFNIKLPYLFFIGGISENKNIKRLIKAFKILNKKQPDFNLVLAGIISSNKMKNLIKKSIKNLGLEKKVFLTDQVTEEEKTVLYKNATAFVFPSLHEGFGLPLLEAQSFGIPVLTSNTTALPEVGGKGALYVDPLDVKDIARGMEKIAFNEALRKDLIKKGLENTKRFSWEKAAKETLKILKGTL